MQKYVITRTISRLMLVTVVVLGSDQVAAQEELRPLFKSTDTDAMRTAVAADTLGDTGIRARIVTIDRDALPRHDGRETGVRAAAARVLLNFIPRTEVENTVQLRGISKRSRGFVVAALLDEVDQSSADTVTWLGQAVGDPASSVSITVHADIVLVAFRSPRYRAIFEVLPLATDTTRYVVREVSEERIPECGVGRVSGDGRERGDSRQEPKNPVVTSATAVADSQLIVMGLYTPRARTAAGSKTAIEGLIRDSIARGNRALRRSLISAQFQLVHMQEVENYVEKGFRAMLYDLRYVDGELDYVHDLRNTHKADMVFMIVNNSAIGGIGYIMSSPSSTFASAAYSVTSRSSAYSTITVAHEMGHNMGSCHHPDDNACDGAYSYSFGHRFTGTDGLRYRTVMAYRPPRDRIENFSNPSVIVQGRPTGTATRNNARSINNTAPIVANFRR